MSHIVLITSAFTVGGAERVMAILANEWAGRGIRVTALALGETGKKPFFPFSEAVHVLCLGLQGDSRNLLLGAGRNLIRIRALRRTLQDLQADIAIPFLDTVNIVTLLAARGLGLPVIISERTDPAGRDIGWPWELMRRITYSWADRLVCQGERPLRYFPEPVRRRGLIIPNPVILPEDFRAPRTGRNNANQNFKVVALGSLRQEKGFDLLLKAFAQAIKKHSNWSLIIWGEGPDLPLLEAQADALGIKDYVSFPGLTREPFTRLTEADLFVLSSRVEGFPNALCEAMAVGLPVIATDVGAVADIVCDGKNGVLVPPNDVASLAATLHRLMGDQTERLRLAGRAPEVMQRFGKEKIICLWEDVISEVTGKKFFKRR